MRCFWATLLIGCLASPAFAADPSGDWMVTDKTAAIRIAPCASASAKATADKAFCGSIVWTREPPGTDQNNPDPAKRSRSVIGLPIIIDMKPSTNPNEWEGEIYNAENGKIYSGSIALANAGVLRVQGCVLGFLCGGQDWTRARCQDAKGAGTSPSQNRSAASASRPASVVSCSEERASASPPRR